MNISSDDPRLTAYALGELDPAGRSLIENEMQRSDECRLLAREIADFAAQLRAALATEPMPEPASSNERAIESGLRQTGVRREASWVPFRVHWLIKAGLTALAMMVLWYIPAPGWLANSVAKLSVSATTDTVFAMLQVTGTPVVRHGMWFVLPRATIQFAELCAPFYATGVLLAASLLAGNLCLRSLWKRIVLAALVVPVSFLTDVLRGFSLVELLVHTGRNPAELPIIHYFQLIFFALSVVLLLLILFWLRRTEARSR